MEELHPASVTFTPAKIYCIIKPQTTKTITFIFMIVSLCQVKKKKVTLKPESEGEPFTDCFAARRKTITRDTEIVSRVEITHGIFRGVLHKVSPTWGGETGKRAQLQRHGQGMMLPIICRVSRARAASSHLFEQDGLQLSPTDVSGHELRFKQHCKKALGKRAKEVTLLG